jgi:hypothetical protein
MVVNLAANARFRQALAALIEDQITLDRFGDKLRGKV